MPIFYQENLKRKNKWKHVFNIWLWILLQSMMTDSNWWKIYVNVVDKKAIVTIYVTYYSSKGLIFIVEK